MAASTGCREVQAWDVGAHLFVLGALGARYWGRGKQLALGTELCWLLNNCGDCKCCSGPHSLQMSSWVGLESGQPEKDGQDAKVPIQEGRLLGTGA